MILQVEVFTLFPQMIDQYVGQSILGRATEAELLNVTSRDLRAEAKDPHRTVDDSPFGGGAGMVMMPEPVFAAVEQADPPRPLILLGPGGRTFNQSVAEELAALDGFSLLCGRYEGVDERIRTELCDDEISLGDYVLAGGELAALAVIEAVARLRPGVLGNVESSQDESFSTGLLEYPHYTRPADFRSLMVPEVLRSGDHGRVARWRKAQALGRTLKLRPDLIADRGGLNDEEKKLLEEFSSQEGQEG
ncbi:MAG: tRNA (guanosine(37)-N1)-methyltransferase TrmD [Acidimicrobiales bacterium]|jgi:tRNA (guanine37-N1)-methyltransferase